MPRKKTLSDTDLLDRVLTLMRRSGPQGVTFAAAASETGLSGPTLVQRFGTRDGLLHAALLRAWDLLDERTETAIATQPKTPAGAVATLVTLSGDFGSGENYAEGLLVLREDLRNPELRARGDKWGKRLADALGQCFADASGARPDLGRLLAGQWQGALLWWGFSRNGIPAEAVKQDLTAFCRAIGREI
ncbi:transcriptional regulator, TetR family [Mesorhizobium albiziae]|uniref:Transcriptional regulator, TetR family n=1 Tax=Neomesorhizobium albiziae TaxID=335020 RepID=A0A1I4DFZ6_9HYPH|nr:TetR/AcrR family transcriptional regulator [Mesorhizobium albiziae]GLS32355.1 TetR family transcriptional regulator [Mesorhizobium albiziae]SFK91407.1 transcriptional regulator, TetR family [Mesorhizobium albiziae]